MSLIGNILWHSLTTSLCLSFYVSVINEGVRVYTCIPFQEQQRWLVASAESQAFAGYFRSSCAAAVGSIECFSTGRDCSTTIIFLFMPVAQKVFLCWRWARPTGWKLAVVLAMKSQTTDRKHKLLLHSRSSLMSTVRSFVKTDRPKHNSYNFRV